MARAPLPKSTVDLKLKRDVIAAVFFCKCVLKLYNNPNVAGIPLARVKGMMYGFLSSACSKIKKDFHSDNELLPACDAFWGGGITFNYHRPGWGSWGLVLCSCPWSSIFSSRTQPYTWNVSHQVWEGLVIMTKQEVRSIFAGHDQWKQEAEGGGSSILP